MANNNEFKIIVDAILNSKSGVDIKKELDKISKNLNIKVNADIDNVVKQFNVLKDGTKNLQRVTTSVTNEYNQQVKVIANVDAKTKELAIHTEVVTDNLKKQRAEQEKIAKLQTNLQNKVELFKKSSELKLKDTQGKYGSLVDTNAVAKLKKDIDSLSATSPDATNKMKQYSLAMKEIEVNARNSSKAQRLAQQDARSLGSEIWNSAKKFTEWYLLAGGITTVIGYLKDGIVTVYQMNTALTELAKVVDMSDKQLYDMSVTAVQMGKALGQSSVDIMKSMAEFGRITKDAEEIKNLSFVAGMSSNVTDMSAQEAAKALTSTMITFGIEAKDSMKILDSWNTLQNNFRKFMRK